MDSMGLHGFTLCLMVICFMEASTLDSLFCGTKNDTSGKRSCSNALWGPNISEADSCIMWFPATEGKKSSPRRNSKECLAVPFEVNTGHRQSVIPDLGTVQLRAFAEGQSTGINVTFSNIKWTSMWMRFKSDANNNNNICREFTISSPVPPEKILYYDCLWLKPSPMEWKEMTYEFHLSNPTSSTVFEYRFKAPLADYIKPSNKRLNESELFMYMDVTNLSSGKLYLQTAKERFNISVESYVVTLHQNISDKVTSMNLKPVLMEEDQITYHYNTDGQKGSYYFTAKINDSHINCTKEPCCYITQSPQFVIKGFQFDKVTLLAIAGFGAILLAVVSFTYFLWRMWTKSLSAGRPTVLMVYSPTTAKHTRTVVEFAKFLSKYCHVNALVDELGIPLTTSKDPFTWCNDSFSKANAIMVLASPPVACVHYQRIYRNIDALSLRLLKEKMSDRQSALKYLAVVLPHCKNNEAGIPDEAKHLRRFDLATDLVKMLTFVHYNSIDFAHQISVRPLIEGGLVEYARNGSDFAEALREAEEEVRVGVEKCIHCSSGSADHETGPLLMQKFKLADVQRCAMDDHDMLVWPDVKHSPVTDEMFPGPIENLNLLGTEGTNYVDNSNEKISLNGGFNINKLDLG